MKTRLTYSQRLQIQYLNKQNKSYRFIARTIGCHQQTVKRWANEPFGNLKEDQRSGRPEKANQRKKRIIVQEALNDNMSLRKLARKYKLSHQTINNII